MQLKTFVSLVKVQVGLTELGPTLDNCSRGGRCNCQDLNRLPRLQLTRTLGRTTSSVIV